MGAGLPLKNTCTPPKEVLSSAVGIELQSAAVPVPALAPDGHDLAGRNARGIVRRCAGDGGDHRLRHGHGALRLRNHQQRHRIRREGGGEAVAADIDIGVWRTMAPRFVELYCHTCAVAAGVKLARLMRVGNSAGGLVQHQHGQRGIYALGGEDG